MIKKFVNFADNFLLCCLAHLLAVLLALFATLQPSFALEKPEEDLQHAGLITQLGTQIDLSLQFTKTDGQKVALKDLISGNRPFILTPVYYGCPRLCGMVLSHFTTLLNNLPLKLGKDYEVVTVSFDSSEGPEDALKRQEKFHNLLVGQDMEKDKWSFLTGEDEAIEKLMKKIGFLYKFDNGEFAHSAVIMIVSPAGKISQFFTDINFPIDDVKLALVEASEGKIGTAIDHFLLFCYRFDPTKGKYTLAAWTFVQVGVLFCMAVSLTFVYRYGLKK